MVLVAVMSIGEHVCCAAPVTGLQVTRSHALVGVGSGICGFEHAPVAGLHVPAVWQASLAVQTTPTPAHVPFEHASFEVHASWSLQEVPFGSAGFEHVPVEGLHVPAEWHWSEAVQVTVAPAVQVPAWHVSFESQALPSLHEVPLAAVGLEQSPVNGLHAPATWHWSEATQVTLPPAVHAPARHVSFKSQALPSLQPVPSVAVGFEHWPVPGLHVPATWHWSDAVHVTVLPAVHTPAWHVSFESHTFPSLQLVPFATVGFEHCPVVGLHVPAV